MPLYKRVIVAQPGRVLIPQAKWCNTFTTKLQGFTFRRQLKAGEGLVLVEKKDSRVSTAIHMLFVFCELGVVWVNSVGEVVDTRLAKPWRLSYAPQAPAQYVIEGHPDILQHIRVGDTVKFEV